ncbi:TetR/AcrR family transcriptional regulator [Cohnella luojiensis]|uniref:TetR/AcrR family transcriptional regulator n=1 Tax=Cohnella luojiensis TaxID=652876 RepID=A0A4Y8MAX4_9BACL|nr:TetR/AcrR family transcriptional regulator [Cohnella luojiensis]TFE31527.1 TetR/AcrR family transcriptional regulator [Cohnella luojiensis]
MTQNGSHEEQEEVLKSLPNGVTLSWGIIKQPRRGPKGELSIEKIVAAAIAIADQDGLPAVSMSRVAQSLGYSTMSLYRYIASKEDLLILMQDAVSNVPIPPEDAALDWRDGMREYVRVCVQVFRDHPWYSDIPIMSIPTTPNTLQIIDWLLRTMRDFPLNDYEKISFVLLLSSYARACGMIQRDMDRVIQSGRSPESFSGSDYSAALKYLVKADRFPDLYPVIHSGAYTDDTDSPIGNDLDFGLERILDGIAHYLENKRK